MKTQYMVGIALGFILLIGLFPPRSADRSSKTPHHVPVKRGFLLAKPPVSPANNTTSGLGNQTDHIRVGSRTKIARLRCHIDVGRLICEGFVVAGLTGLVIVFGPLLPIQSINPFGRHPFGDDPPKD